MERQPRETVSDVVMGTEEIADLSAVNVQTRRFVQYLMLALVLVSTYLIWSDVFPAFQRLQQIPLWSVGAGEPAVTLGSLLAAVLILVLTFVAARNLPGILEVSILQRLQVEAGGRYAINALVRYTVMGIGVVLAFSAIGVRWAHVQWLLAAMTVGLGFGLQEIFGNFVSGLIILFERPVRIGDIVTVGGITGTVTRIRIRATTITDWDRKELIVPNKEFITGQLVNWTLSDNIIRVVIPVGIAYGSDTKLAHELLLKAAKECPRVLDDPEPMAFFMDFGESSLNFELRVHVGGLNDFLQVRNDLHMAIDQAFREAHIEIAFPQRDVHVRSIKAALPLESGRRKQPPNAVDPPKGL
jgi:potassium efflux system protein